MHLRYYILLLFTYILLISGQGIAQGFVNIDLVGSIPGQNLSSKFGSYGLGVRLAGLSNNLLKSNEKILFNVGGYFDYMNVGSRREEGAYYRNQYYTDVIINQNLYGFGPLLRIMPNAIDKWKIVPSLCGNVGGVILNQRVVDEVLRNSDNSSENNGYSISRRFTLDYGVRLYLNFKIDDGAYLGIFAGIQGFGPARVSSFKGTSLDQDGIIYPGSSFDIIGRNLIVFGISTSLIAD
ncbi:MAG: hypothetical protein SGJ04_08570 [Bacteroidota bacterium]|nr:hypothetical protein [Bacteroidota bacterium]